jgi:hypothetical protein
LVEKVSRISQLPRRDWKTLAAPYVEPLSALLRTPHGKQTLRIAQAAVLLEGPMMRGVVEQGRVGIGKSLALALMPVVLGSKRPLILTKGGLLKDAREHIEANREHWQLPADLQLLSYTVLSNMPRQELSLRSIWPEGPDYIGCDEVQALAGVRTSAVAKLLQAWAAECPECIFFDVTGSFDLHGLPSYAHLFDWALRGASPLPRTPHEVKTWHTVIGEGDVQHTEEVCDELGIKRTLAIEAIRSSFRERILTAPGVIVDDTPYTAVPLTVAEQIFDVQLESEFEQLRELGQRPDGLDVLPDDAETDEQEAAEPDRVANGQVAETSRQLSGGWFYKLLRPAPPDWLKKRRSYFRHVRSELESGVFLTEAQVRAAAIADGLKVWSDWASIQPTFVPEFRAMWLNERLAEAVSAWAAQGPGIVWCEHIAVGTHLQKQLGFVYYAGKGRSDRGDYITDGPRPSKKVVLASRQANGEGRNLQFQWDRQLFIQPVGNSYMFEQTVGREHREGLETWSPGCRVDMLMRCTEDFRSRDRIHKKAKTTAESFYSQKACSVPWAKVARPGSGWAFQ